MRPPGFSTRATPCLLYLPESCCKRQLAAPRLQSSALTKLFSSLDDVTNILDSGPTEQRREFISHFVERVIVYPSHLEVFMKFSLNDLDPGGSQKQPLQQVFDRHIPGLLGDRFRGEYKFVAVRQLCKC